MRCPWRWQQQCWQQRQQSSRCPAQCLEDDLMSPCPGMGEVRVHSRRLWQDAHGNCSSKACDNGGAGARGSSVIGGSAHGSGNVCARGDGAHREGSYGAHGDVEMPVDEPDNPGAEGRAFCLESTLPPIRPIPPPAAAATATSSIYEKPLSISGPPAPSLKTATATSPSSAAPSSSAPMGITDIHVRSHSTLMKWWERDYILNERQPPGPSCFVWI